MILICSTISWFCLRRREEWDIEETIETKDDLYTKIQVLQVDIVKESYHAALLLS